MKGTVIKRGSRWSVVIDLGRDVDGKRIRKWHSGYRTKREAEQARIEILSQRDAARVADRIGQLRLSAVSTATLNSLYRELGETLAPATVKNTHAVVHKALKDAVRQGILARNPAEHVKLPRPEPLEANTWTADELARFLDHVAAYRLGVAWRGAWCVSPG